jgi:hypothetical protein
MQRTDLLLLARLTYSRRPYILQHLGLSLATLARGDIPLNMTSLLALQAVDAVKIFPAYQSEGCVDNDILRSCPLIIPTTKKETKVNGV